MELHHRDYQESALSRWALSYNARSEIIAIETREIYNMALNDSPVHNETNKSLQMQNNKDEKNVYETPEALPRLTRE